MLNSWNGKQGTAKIFFWFVFSIHLFFSELSMAYLYLFIAVIAEVIATSSIKASAGFSKLGPSLLVVIGYTLSFVLLSLVLKTVPVGIAYASWSGIGMAFVAIISYFLYGQKLDAVAMCGIGMIITGVLVINLFSKTAN